MESGSAADTYFAVSGWCTHPLCFCESWLQQLRKKFFSGTGLCQNDLHSSEHTCKGMLSSPGVGDSPLEKGSGVQIPFPMPEDGTTPC